MPRRWGHGSCSLPRPSSTSPEWSLAQAGAPVTRTAAVMGDGNDENLVTFQNIDNLISEAFDRPRTDAKDRRTSRAWMVDEEITSGVKGSNKTIAVAGSLSLQVSSGLDKLSASLGVQFAGHHPPHVSQRPSPRQQESALPYRLRFPQRDARSPTRTAGPTQRHRSIARCRVIVLRGGPAPQGSVPSPHHALLRRFAT